VDVAVVSTTLFDEIWMAVHAYSVSVWPRPIQLR
jgi:hypothetical protein